MTLKHSPYAIRCYDIGAQCGDISARRSQRHRRSLGVSGDCGVGVTSQMCNRVTNHGDMGTFSKPVFWWLLEAATCCRQGPQCDGKCSFYFVIFFRTNSNKLKPQTEIVYLPAWVKDVHLILKRKFRTGEHAGSINSVNRGIAIHA